MRTIYTKKIEKEVYKLCLDANYFLEDDLCEKISNSIKSEKSSIGKEVLVEIEENFKIAKKEKKPICQDTGMAVFFVDIGDKVSINGDINLAINNGVKKAYIDGKLRKSIVKDVLNRENTGDNTPAVIHYNFYKGNRIKISFAPKGFGSENMSKIKMLAPANGVEGIKKFIIKTVKNAGPNPCPPIVVGVGIGGNFEMSAILAKKALLRKIGERNRKSFYSDLEIELLEKINKLGIGPQGYGGTTTALELFIEEHPTHIAGLPVAVNISCHANRHKDVII